MDHRTSQQMQHFCKGQLHKSPGLFCQIKEALVPTVPREKSLVFWLGPQRRYTFSALESVGAHRKTVAQLRSTLTSALSIGTLLMFSFLGLAYLIGGPFHMYPRHSTLGTLLRDLHADSRSVLNGRGKGPHLWSLGKAEADSF